jgi:hypothetical protein
MTLARFCVHLRIHGRAKEARRRLILVGLGSGFHALVSFRQCPELTRELGAIDEVWLVVVWATVP